MNYILATLLLLVPAWLLESWVIGYLWTWFVVPVFGVPNPEFKIRLGLSVLAGILFAQYIPSSHPDKEEDAKARLFFLFVRPLIMLALGWIAHSWNL